MTEWLVAALVVALVGDVLLWAQAHSACPHGADCLRCAADRRAAAEKRAESRHGMEHSGFWYGGGPDSYDCGDPKCPRNKK